MWVKPATLEVFKLHFEVRRAFPRISFPEVMTDADVAEVGLVALVQVPAPTFNRYTQKLVELPPAQVSGIWTQQWSVVALTALEVKAAVPAQVDAYQLRTALEDAGHLDTIEALLAAGSVPKKLRLAWKHKRLFRRTDSIINAMRNALSLTEAQVDALFIAATEDQT